METNKYIAAIDLGTSKIVGVVGTKSENGHLVVLAIEKEDAGGCIKRGVIQNVEEAASRVKKIITKLENRIPEKLSKVYVGVGGHSLRSVNHKIVRQLNEDTQVTEELIQSIISEGRNFPVYNAEVLDVVPTDYLLDNRVESHPQGVFCSDIEARLSLIVGRMSLKKNIFRCLVERVKMPIASYIPAPLAVAAATLFDNEKELGCALIDFGGGTTTLSIYKDGFLRYVVTIPFGGRNITRDICSLNVLDQEAEHLKVNYGSAVSSAEGKNAPVKIEGVDAAKIKYPMLCRVVEARMEEIVENIASQLDASGYSRDLAAGIVITGGASQLKELPALLKQKTSLDVRKGVFPRNVAFANKQESVFNPAYVMAVGLLLQGTESCVKEREVVVPVVTEPEAPVVSVQSEKTGVNGIEPDVKSPQSPKKKWWNITENLKGRMEGMFDEDDTELK